MALTDAEKSEIAAANQSVQRLDQKIADVFAKLGDMNYLLMAVILVLLVGFATAFVTVWGLVLDATRFKTETYQDLVNEVRDQKSEVDSQNSKIDTLSTKIDNLNYLIRHPEVQ